MKNTWFNGDKTNTKQKKQKGMLGDELSKAELIGSKLRLREDEEIEEEKEAPNKVVKESKITANTTTQQESKIDTKQVIEPKKDTKLTIQHSAPFPIKNTSLTTQAKPEEDKKPYIQKSSPFPPRREVVQSEPQIQETKVEVKQEQPKKLDILHSSPFPPRRTMPEEKPKEKKQDYLDVKPAWMQNVSFEPQPIDRTNKDKDDVQIIIEDKNKASERDVAKEIIRKAPKENFIDVSPEIIKEEKKIEEKIEEKQYKNMYQTLDSSNFFNSQFNQEPVMDPYAHPGVDEGIEHEEELDEETQDYGTSLEFDFSTTFNVGLQEETEKFVEFETSFAPEATYGFEDAYTGDDPLEESYEDKNDHYDYYGDTLGFTTSFDLSSIGIMEEESEEEYLTAEESATTEELYDVSQDLDESLFYTPPIEEETNPVESRPTEPTSIESAPIEPTPIEPTPIEPTLIEPTPIELTPAETIPLVVEEIPAKPVYNLPTSIIISFEESCLHKLNGQVGNVVMLLNSAGEKYDFAITKNDNGGQNLKVAASAEMVSRVNDLFNQEADQTIRSSVVINFDTDHIQVLNMQVGNVIMLLNAAGEKYDFSITKDDKGGQNLSVACHVHIISKIMAFFI